MSELTARQEEYLDALPQPSYQAWADAVGASESSAEEMRRRLTDENDDIEIEKVDGEWLNTFGDADDPSGRTSTSVKRTSTVHSRSPLQRWRTTSASGRLSSGSAARSRTTTKASRPPTASAMTG